MRSLWSRAIARKRNATARRKANSEALAAHATAVGCTLTPNDVGYLKNHLPPHLGDRLLATIAEVKAHAGLIQVSVWVRPENIAKIQAIAEDTGPIDAEEATLSQTVSEEIDQICLDTSIEAWFQDVQSGVRPQHDLVAEAVAFKTRLDKAARNAFIDTHSIDGTFILRLIDSWASRTDIVPDPDEQSPCGERTALRAALRRVHMEKPPTLLLENPLQG